MRLAAHWSLIKLARISRPTPAVAYCGEGAFFFSVFAALLPPVRRIKKDQITATCLLGETMGYVISGYVIPNRLKVVYQTASFHVAANIQSSAASAKGIYNQGLGAGKIVKDVPDNLPWYPAGERKAEGRFA